MLSLLESYLEGVDIVEFQYGLRETERAFPVFGIDAMPAQFAAIEQQMLRDGLGFENVTGQEDVEFKVINYDPSLFRHPYFVKIEFPEAGALHDFPQQSCVHATIVYFNYSYTGERVGRASLLGLDFDSPEARTRFEADVQKPDTVLRAAQEIPATVLARLRRAPPARTGGGDKKILDHSHRRRFTGCQG